MQNRTSDNRRTNLNYFQKQNPPCLISIKQSFSGLSWNAQQEQYRQLGYYQLDDEVFEALCITRIAEPTSKLDILKVMADMGNY